MKQFVVFAVIAAAGLCLGAAEPDQYGRGLILASPKDYAAFPVLPRYRAFLPERVDLSDRAPPPAPEGQGQQGSCTAWATTYAARSYLRYNELGHRPSALDEVMSPAFVYNAVKPNRGDCRSGSAIATALDFLETTGAVTLANMPYDEKHCDYDVPTELVEAAAHYRIGGWERVNITTLDDIKGQLAKGRPVIVGMLITSLLGEYKGGIYHWDITGPSPGAHAMVVVGYDDREGTIKLLNSWGTRWGEAGYIRADYAHFQAAAREAYVILPAQTPVPPLPPPPPPPPVRDVEQALRQGATSLQCAHVDVSRRPDSTIEAKGYVGTEDDAAALRRIAAGSERPVELKLEVNPWPLCEIRNVAEATPDGLKVTLERLDVGGVAPMKANADGPRLTDGEEFRLRLSAAPRYAYLQVFYVSADGSANEIYRGPNPANTGAGAELVLGRGGSRAGPKGLNAAGPPFGHEAVVVVGAEDGKPLWPAAARPYDNDRDMLSRLREAIWSRRDAGATSVRWLFLTTAPGG